jgi:metal-responsive CopG/Arc/MetJ family transcriptional regulator
VSGRTVRTTLALPADLLAAVDEAVRKGQARRRKELVTTALQHEPAARRRAEIDAGFAGMAADPDSLVGVAQLEREFDRAFWEAFRHAEREYLGEDDATR